MHKIVDKKEIFAAVAPTDELHEVPVPKPTNDAHLGDELLPSLSRGLRHLLDGHFSVHVTQESSVHRPETSSPKRPVIGKVVGRGDELAVGKSPWTCSTLLELIVHEFKVEESCIFWCFFGCLNSVPLPPPV